VDRDHPRPYRGGALPHPRGGPRRQARAIGVGEDPEIHRRDVAFLLSLAAIEIDQVTADLDSTDRTLLCRHPEFGQPDGAFWRVIDDHDDTVLAYRAITR
jgi:hypothetical protein